MSRSSEQLEDAEREEGAVLFLRARETKRSGDLRALQSWTSAKVERQDLIEGLERVWGGIGLLSDDPRMVEWRIDAAAAENPSPAHARAFVYFALAASLVLAVLIGSAALLHAPWKSSDRQQFATSVGQRERLTLSDGSVILLDANSQLAVDYTAGERIVRLVRGQARFRVAHDRNRPFHVEAGAEDVRALGTDFNVDMGERRRSVSLIDGSVLVSHIEERPALFGWRRAPIKRPIITLKPGQQLDYDGEGHLRLRHFNADIINAWQSGRIIFEDLPLADAVAIVNRHSRRPVMLDPRLPPSRLTGVFNAGDGLAFARAAVTYLPGARLDISERQIAIRRTGNFSATEVREEARAAF